MRSSTSLPDEALGDGGDHVVGLEAVDLEDRDAHRLDHLDGAGELGVEVVGRRLALGLVGRVEGLALGRLVGDVERDGQVVGPLLGEDVQQHLREHVHRLHGSPDGLESGRKGA
jgi:hypothetical protein